MTAPCANGDCPGCREFRAIHGRLCPELPLDVRLAKRATDRAAIRRWENAATQQAHRGAA